MATTIEVDEKIAAALRAEANVRGLSLSDFLQQVALSAMPTTSLPQLSQAELETAIDEASSNAGSLPNDFSRSDIYRDHD